jgi:hypothetical protein
MGFWERRVFKQINKSLSGESPSKTHTYLEIERWCDLREGYC